MALDRQAHEMQRAMPYDYFISHASEDKDLVARPLAHYLKTSGFGVWYDEFSLKVGDSLRASIDRGLGDSTHGIVILSKDFLRKKWTERELNGLFALTSDVRRIIPVWHDIGIADVAAFSPMLADIKSVTTSRGLQVVAEEIVGATLPERVRDLPVSNVDRAGAEDASKAREVLIQVLQASPKASEVFIFVSAYQVLLRSLFGYRPRLIPAHKLPSPFAFDFAVIQPHGVSGPMEVVFVILGPTDRLPDAAFMEDLRSSIGPSVPHEGRPGNDYLGPPYVGTYPAVLQVAEATRAIVSVDNVNGRKPDVWSFRFLVLAGRRAHDAVSERDQLRRVESLRVEIASYDRLLDTEESLYRQR